MFGRIKAISTYLPQDIETNEDLNLEFPEWSVEKIFEKTGIESRHKAGVDEFSSHLGTKAAERLFEEQRMKATQFDYLIFVTQTPDFLLPTTACIVHNQLGMRQDAFALDINLGCSGYVAALGQANGLIASGQAKNVLVITSDTYTKLLNPADRVVRTIFGDGATATWVGSDGDEMSISKFIYGTDGSGAGALIVPRGSLRPALELSPASDPVSRGLEPTGFDLFMNGSEIFNFTLRISEGVFDNYFDNSHFSSGDFDYSVFHQANAFMLKHLRQKLGVPEHKFPILMKKWGNTVSSTIPMALAEMIAAGAFETPKRTFLFGFGVGLSWAATSVTIGPFTKWRQDPFEELTGS